MFKLDRGFAINSSDKSLITTTSMQDRNNAILSSMPAGNSQSATGMGTGKNGISQSISSTNVNLMMLDGILSDDRSIRNRIFKDIFFHDAIAGAAAELWSTLPFGDFHLTGVSDKSRLEKFATSTAMVHPMELLPQVTLQFLVLGSFLGTKNWDPRQRICTGIVCHDIQSVKAINVPVTGAQPIFDLNLDKNFMRLLQNNKDPRVNSIIQKLPEMYKQSLQNGVIELQPQNTIFVARRTLAGDIMGTSYYERILPVHLIEKAITRGTIDASNRRQRAILHIQMGDVDDWLPNQSDLDACRNAFQNADMDPQGTIVVTRTGVSASEIRPPLDFWSMEQVDGWTAPIKYRALGMSPDMIDGTASLSTLDASLSIMVNKIRSFRKFIEREVFTNNLFADIALANDFKKKGNHTVLGSDGLKIGQDHPDYDRLNFTISSHAQRDAQIYASDRFGGERDFKGNLVDLHNYDIPRIVWHQSLSPEGDSMYYSMLKEGLDAGLPVPITSMTAAMGLDLNEVLNGQAHDLETRKRVAKYMEQIQQLSGNDSNNQVAAALASDLAPNSNNINKRGLANREFNRDDYCYNTYEDGKYRVTTPKERRRREENLIKNSATALANLAAKRNHSIKIQPKNSTTTFVDMKNENSSNG